MKATKHKIKMRSVYHEHMLMEFHTGKNMTNTSYPFFSKERIIACEGYNRWFVVFSALLIHLSIGQVNAFSVFNKPMSMLLGITQSTPDDWKLTTLGWIFSLAIVFLGLSAAFGGKWLERVGPRKTMFCSACFFGGGFFVAGFGCYLHQIWIVYLGYGVFGGIGLGLGYVSPVATLLRWFPDRRGMAAGMAIMGFGGGALIGAPLAVHFIHYFSSSVSTGVYQTLFTLGVIYFFAMTIGALIIRVPAENWKPKNWSEILIKKHQSIDNDVSVDADCALKTPQFWLLWIVLCCNITAGIGVLGQASVMIQEVFQNRITPMNAAFFVSGLSLFNMLGRFLWASFSDVIGRKATYSAFFLLGAFLYFITPYFGKSDNLTLFIVGYLIILSMYGGGFATIPAYLADTFGVRFVGAIHGRLLTAWSTAGVVGPVLVNYIRQYQIDHHVSAANAYNTTMHIMAGLLIVGYIANLLVRPISKKYYT